MIDHSANLPPHLLPGLRGQPQSLATVTTFCILIFFSRSLSTCLQAQVKLDFWTVLQHCWDGGSGAGDAFLTNCMQSFFSAVHWSGHWASVAWQNSIAIRTKTNAAKQLVVLAIAKTLWSAWFFLFFFCRWEMQLICLAIYSSSFRDVLFLFFLDAFSCVSSCNLCMHIYRSHASFMVWGFIHFVTW